MLYIDEVVLVDNCGEFSFDTNCNGGFVDIGFVYSRKDPQQTRARDFILKYLRERGVLAQVVETESDVKSPTVIINGRTFTDLRKTPRGDKPGMYPAIKDIAEALDRHLWAL
jgi:hypothetical protein